MELSPPGPDTERQDEQDSMFDHAADFPGHDLTELPGETVAAEERDDYAEPSLLDESGPAADSQEDTYPDADSVPPPVDLLASAGPLTIGDFAALEERVLRAVNLVRRERQARLAAEERAEVLQGRVLALESELPQLQASHGALEQSRQEIDTLRAEREQVRQRVERLLGQLDALEL